MKKRDRNKKERPSDQKEEREIKRIKASDVEEDVDVSAKTMVESVQVQASKTPKRKRSSKSKRKISDDNKAKDDDKMVSDHILHHD